MNDAIDFAKINRAALAAFPAILRRILPGGKRVGKEIVALNPHALTAISVRSRSTGTTAKGRTLRRATRAAIRCR